MYNKTLLSSRALFSIKQTIFGSTIKPSAVLRIFDSLIKPIALYDSELWEGHKHVIRTNPRMKYLTCFSNVIMDLIKNLPDSPSMF